MCQNRTCKIPAVNDRGTSIVIDTVVGAYSFHELEDFLRLWTHFVRPAQEVEVFHALFRVVLFELITC